jgi:hypothetical protein
MHVPEMFVKPPSLGQGSLLLVEVGVVLLSLSEEGIVELSTGFDCTAH